MKHETSILLGLASLLLALTSACPGPTERFLLSGTAKDALDPKNVANEVISIDNPEGTACRGLRVKIETLDNQLQFKYFYPDQGLRLPPGPGLPLGAPRSCGGGSPRISLHIDVEGDGHTDFTAQGHIGGFPNFTTCPAGEWQFEDLTDDQKRWETTPTTVCGQAGGAGTCTWDELEARVTAKYPNHKVLSGCLVDDSGSFFKAAAGLGFYDNVTIGNRTIQNHSDTEVSD